MLTHKYQPATNFPARFFLADVAVDKNGLRSNVKADSLAAIASIDDYDLEVRELDHFPPPRGTKTGVN